jgi:DNA-binding transcriptional LysR family regulator
MDRLGAMQLFVRVAERGSFAAVANQLGVAPSMVTRQLAALETHLGSKLIERSTRRLRLTSAGLAYLERCRVILNLVEVAETDIARENQTPRGHIRLSMPLAFGTTRMVPLLLEFLRRYPEVGLEMEFSDKRQNLIEEGLDLSVRIATDLAPGDVARRLGVSRMKVIAAPGYLARHGCPRTPAELSDHEFLGYSYGPVGTIQFLVAGRRENIPVRGRVMANNGAVLAEAAAQELGIAIGPDFIVDDFIAAGRLEQILIDHEMPSLGIHAVLPSNRQVPYRVRALLDFLSARLC